MNDWVLVMKCVENFDMYGLVIVDFYYFEIIYLNL